MFELPPQRAQNARLESLCESKMSLKSEDAQAAALS